MTGHAQRTMASYSPSPAQPIARDATGRAVAQESAGSACSMRPNHAVAAVGIEVGTRVMVWPSRVAWASKGPASANARCSGDRA